jgi:hypothetical protein
VKYFLSTFDGKNPTDDLTCFHGRIMTDTIVAFKIKKPFCSIMLYTEQAMDNKPAAKTVSKQVTRAGIFPIVINQENISRRRKGRMLSPVTVKEDCLPLLCQLSSAMSTTKSGTGDFSTEGVFIAHPQLPQNIS